MYGASDIVKLVCVLAMFLLIYFIACMPNGLGWHYTFDANMFPQELIPNRGAYIQYPEVPYFTDVWFGSQVLRGELTAAEWINDHTLKSDKFVADIGGAECIMGMTTRISLVGGDWANAPDPVHNMETAGRIYSTGSADEAHRLARSSGCSYVLLPRRRLNTGTFDNYANATKFEDAGYFQMVYKNDDVTIYRVLP